MMMRFGMQKSKGSGTPSASIERQGGNLLVRFGPDGLGLRDVGCNFTDERR